MIKPEEIRSWIEQVEDEETSVQDYDFLDRLLHGGPEHNGSGGLANVGAYLAIHEEDGEIVVEEDLVEALDERQSEENVGKRFRNIVYDAQTSKREGNTLYDRGVKGHEFLERLAIEFERNVDLDSLPSNDESVLKAYTQNHISNDNEGGDNSNMTDQDYNAIEHALSTAVENHNEYTKEQLHGIARLEHNGVDVIDELVGDLEEYREEGMTTMQAVQGYLDQQANGNLEAMNDHIETLYQKVDSIDLSDRGNLNGEVVDTIENITGNSYTI